MEQGNGVGAAGGASPMSGEQMVAEQVTVTQVEPVAPAEPVTPVGPVVPGSMVAEPKASKKGHGMAIGLIFCLLLAAGGVGLGVWAMMDGTSQKDALNSQIADLKKQNNELRDKLSSKQEVEEDVTVDVETDSDVNTADYIYVGEWGYKIKKVDGLEIDKYSFVVVEDDGNTLSRVEIYAGGESDYPLGVVARLSKGKEVVGLSNIVFSDNNYDYYTSGPNGDVSSDLAQALELVKEMISTLENYSKI